MIRSGHTRCKAGRTPSPARIVLGIALVSALTIAVDTPAFAADCQPLQIGGPVGWSTNTPLPIRREGAVGVAIGAKIYVTHGFDPAAGNNVTTFIYDRTTDTWGLGADAIVARGELTGVCIADDHGGELVFVVGGRAADALADVEVYDPSSDTWAVWPSMPTPRRGLGAAWVPGAGVAGGTFGSVYVVGGSDGVSPHEGIPLAVNEAFDVEIGVWVTMAPMPVPMMDIYSTTYSPDTGMIYVFGGYDGVGVSSLVQAYDPTSDSWSAVAPMPSARSNGVSGICGSEIYMIGGFDGLANTAVTEVYDPITDSWGAAPAKPTAASELASQFIYTGTEIYALGSGIFGNTLGNNDVFTCGVISGDDFDGDGFNNYVDNCPLDFNPTQSDLDGDDAGDECDCAPLDPLVQVLPDPIDLGNTTVVTHSPATGTVINWSTVPDAGFYNTYRGTIPQTRPAGVPPAFYNHVCFEDDDSFGDGPTTSTDSSTPTAGEAYYYFSNGENVCAEGSLGRDSSGVTRPNPLCP